GQWTRRKPCGQVSTACSRRHIEHPLPACCSHWLPTCLADIPDGF
ncbi:MAG: hypothetical protein AVDCRST_MAG87-3678, partial [uncultured Thermomicrobiales bacterium]